jgi:hypothetical protein
MLYSVWRYCLCPSSRIDVYQSLMQEVEVVCETVALFTREDLIAFNHSKSCKFYRCQCLKAKDVKGCREGGRVGEEK